MRCCQRGPTPHGPRRPVPPAATLVMLLLRATVVTNVGCCSAARQTQSSTCGRRFLVREGEGDTDSSGSQHEEDDEAARHTGQLSLSRGRGFMGAAMVDDPPLVVFAGGIGVGGKLVDSNVDAFALPPHLSEDGDNDPVGGDGAGGEGEATVVYRDVLS